MSSLPDYRRLKYATRNKMFDKLEEKGKDAESAKPPAPDSQDAPKASTSKASDVPGTSSSEQSKPPAPQESTKSDEDTGSSDTEEPREDPFSDEERALINVWMQSEEEGRQDIEASTGDYDAVFDATTKKFNQYRHHGFGGDEWSPGYDDKGGNDKPSDAWFIPAAAAVGRDEDDPEYLCTMCRQIDFEVLLTHRGLCGNSQPGSDTVIELHAGMRRLLDGSNGCAFCSLVRQSLQDQSTPDEVKKLREGDKGEMRLTVLDDGAEYVLRLEMSFTDDRYAMNAQRVVVQMLAPEHGESLPLQGLPVDQNTADMRRLRAWVQTCEEHHAPVEPLHGASGPSTLRVIDVQESCIVTVDAPSRYACLSYVWGNETGTQLTAETRSVLERAGGLDNASITLGQTLRDAIKVTRDIGLRYLWIDALCILQDDDKDKADIISRMGTIYSNAVITIVASTNTRPADGLPGAGSIPRSRAQVVKKVQGVSLCAAMHDARHRYNDIEDSVWNSRAWTFQERNLSQRAVYFTRSQMCFTCPHEVVFEDTVPGLSADHRPARLVDRSKFTRLTYPLMFHIYHDPTQQAFPNKSFHIHGMGSQSSSLWSDDMSIPAPMYRAEPALTHGSSGGTLRVEGETLWKAYSDAVSMYTRRRMSWQTDALNAFSGVSDLVAQGVNTVFWHGLPEFNFDHALLWYPREPLTRRSHAGASPSWSWAGWEGHTAYRGRGWRNAVTLAPVNVVRWFYVRHSRDLIYDYLVSGEPHTPEDIADFAFQAAQKPYRIVAHNTTKLFHLDNDDGNDGWTVCRDTDRNEHYYTHPAYPGRRFTYPATLPGRKPLSRLGPVPDGRTLFFLARTVPAVFVHDMRNTPHNPAPRVDPFLQLAVPHRTVNRRPWDLAIYHQGYRAGHLALHIPLSSLSSPEPDLGKDSRPKPRRFILTAMSRDTIPSIAPPMTGWNVYWEMHPRDTQAVAFFEWEWPRDSTSKGAAVLGPREAATTPSTGSIAFENGDPYWDTARFGLPTVLDVYNVLLLERHQHKDDDDDDAAWYTRVGVGKINIQAFRHAHPKDTMVTLR